MTTRFVFEHGDGTITLTRVHDGPDSPWQGIVATSTCFAVYSEPSYTRALLRAFKIAPLSRR